MEGPIVPREIHTLYRGRVFTVQIETITLPKGGELKAEIVRHPGSVVLVPMTEAGEIVLVRQYRHAIGRLAWELPAGSLKPGEDVERAAIRECHEEIGLIPADVRRIGSFFPTPGYCDEEMHFFAASGLRNPGADDESAHQDEDEDIEAQAFPLSRVQAMIASGEIVDLKTVAGLSLLLAFPERSSESGPVAPKPSGKGG
jgi:ADP-ribose pyrophosphatase